MAAFVLRVVSRRRTAITVVSASIASTWLVGAAVVVVAAGGPPPPADLAGSLAIPAAAMDAYDKAATAPRAECGLRWQILAGIGRVESNHANGHTISADGSVSPPILGIVLDGSAGVARVDDTDGGTLDGNATYDRAVGPLQFLPSSWQLFGVDANNDGRADPNNLYDAAASAAAHLCPPRRGPLDRDETLTEALRSYNRSDTYVADVLAWIRHYDDPATSGPSPPAPVGAIVAVRGIRVDSSLAINLERLLATAEENGLDLSGGGHRTRDEQILLRRAHCGSSDYAVFETPANRCSPPTARPGESMHESGLAIDFTCGGALVSRPDPCFAFLTRHAAAYGLFNLPTEPWHWSTTGR